MPATPLIVPEPLPDDGEDVVSALETAAVFSAQGDTREAARWVRRAAEAASDVGADMRALTLARAVADLNTASMPPTQAAAPVPSAPAPVAPAPAPVAAAAPPVVVAPPPMPQDDDPTPPPRPSAGPPPADLAAPPPPPLPPMPQRTELGLAPQVAQALGSRPAPTPPPLPTAAEIAAANTPSSPTRSPATPVPAGAPMAGMTPYTSSAVQTSPGIIAPARAVQAAPSAAPVSAAPVAAPPPPLPTPEPPIAPEAPTAPGLIPASGRVTVPALLHQALRASIEPTNEAGVFRLKLLAGNELASLAGHEALVVLLDPNASLLRAE